MPKIVLNMIIGPSEERYLQYALDNVAHEVSLAVINDNGKNANNRERIEQSKFSKESRLVYFQSDFVDFSQARNLCLEHTPKDTWDWMLRLDADEVHYPQTFSQLVGDLQNTEAAIVRAPFYHLLSWRTLQSLDQCPQLYRWKDDLNWQKPVHEEMNLRGPILETHRYYVHYSYTVEQSEVYAKWMLYTDLEQSTLYHGLNPHTIIEDRYATAGAPFFADHPPGAKEYIAQQMPLVGYHDVPLHTAICIRCTNDLATETTRLNIQGTVNPDYPYSIYYFTSPALKETLVARHGDHVVSVYSSDWAEFLELAQNSFLTHRPDIGSFFFIDNGSRFPAIGWQKALVNAIYCIYRGHNAYSPHNATKAILIPSDRIHAPRCNWVVYRSPFVTMEEQ